VTATNQDGLAADRWSASQVLTRQCKARIWFWCCTTSHQR